MCIVTFDAEQNRRESKFCLCKSKFFQKQKPQNHRKICESDCVESFGALPSRILREYWTSNKAIRFLHFSYWPSELTQLCNNQCVSWLKSYGSFKSVIFLKERKTLHLLIKSYGHNYLAFLWKKISTMLFFFFLEVLLCMVLLLEDYHSGKSRGGRGAGAMVWENSLGRSNLTEEITICTS